MVVEESKRKVFVFGSVGGCGGDAVAGCVGNTVGSDVGERVCLRRRILLAGLSERCGWGEESERSKKEDANKRGDDPRAGR